MTALAGIWHCDGRPDAGADCRRMLAAQSLYGPHDSRQWDGGRVAIGRNLFDLLPEDRFDRQPIAAAGGRFMLVADVRLDNREELCAALAIDSEEARALADSALVARAWETWQADMFPHLFGDYAVAVWDAGEQALILARDPSGGRPLHYHRGTDLVAFATMPKGLHALPDIPRAPDTERMAEFLALVPDWGPRTFYKGINRVEPGEFVRLTGDRETHHRHWEPTAFGTWRGGDPVEALRHHIDEAVRVSLRGAGDTVGAHLSAGFDSGTVASTAAKLLAPAGGRVAAFTSVPRTGYDLPASKGRIGNEGPLAAATAALHANMDHVLMPTAEGTPLDSLDRDFHLFEQPLLNLCNARWWSAISAEAKKRRLTVMLTGQMGNMTFSYSGDETLPWLAGKGRFLGLARTIRHYVKQGDMRLSGALAHTFGAYIPGAMWQRLLTWRGRPALDMADYSLVDPKRVASLGLVERARERSLDVSYRPRRDPFETRLWMLRRADPGNINKGVLAGWGLDQRDPTSERRLVEFCLSLPATAWVEGGRRSLAKRALADRLPAAVLNEKRKGMQAADWHEGAGAARHQLAGDIARLRDVPAAAEALDLDRMQALIADWPESGWEKSETMMIYRVGLLRGTAAGHFLRKASGSNM